MRVGRSFAASTFALALTLSGAARAQLFQDQGAAELPQGCNGSGCWTNYARVTDLDGDGDLDLIGVNCGGFFGNPTTTAQPLLVWVNDGAGNFSDGSAMLGSINAPLRQIAIGDVDGDGDGDVYAPSAGGLVLDRLLIQTSPGVFADQAATRLPANLKSDAGAARFGDFDNDGDLDLVVADGYIDDNAVPAHVYRNDGSGVFSLVTGTPTAKNGVNPDDVDVADVDGDFDLDILINFHNGQNSLWLNDGSGGFSDASNKLAALDGGANKYGPAFCDVDGDGDLDLFVDNAGGNYEEQLAINDGAGNFTADTSARLPDNVAADDNLVECLDFDSDGDLDFVIGSLQTQHRLFENDGTGHFSTVDGAFSGPTLPTLWLEAGDLDGDGRLDFFTAQGESSPQTERVFLGQAGLAPDTAAPRVIAVEAVSPSVSASSTVRFRVSDSATTDEGPRLARAWIQLGPQAIDASFVGGDVFRAVLPASGETAFTACAEDLRGNVTPGCDGGTGRGGGGAGGSGSGGASSAGGAGSGAAPSSGGAGVGGGGGGGSDGGCDCRVGVAPRGAASVLMIAVVALLGRLKRRNRSAP